MPDTHTHTHTHTQTRAFLAPIADTVDTMLLRFAEIIVNCAF